MGLLNRMGTIIKAKMSKIIGAAEDPRETLDYSYEKQLDLLQNVKRGVAEVATSKKRLQLQREKQTGKTLPGSPWNERMPYSRRSRGWTRRSPVLRQSRPNW